MKTEGMTKKGLYVGTGAGLIMFVLVGLLPGSLIGGVIGLKMASSIFGSPLGTALLPRLIVAISMIVGVIVSAVAFIIGMGILGWTIGFITDAIRSSRLEAAEMKEVAETK